jgi:hypothetical protein
MGTVRLLAQRKYSHAEDAALREGVAWRLPSSEGLGVGLPEGYRLCGDHRTKNPLQARTCEKSDRGYASLAGIPGELISRK